MSRTQPPKRVAVVTGGGSGIGLAICTHLAERGRDVAILDFDGAAADAACAAVQEIGVRGLAVRVDVSIEADVPQAFDAVRTALGPIDILVTSAAISGFVPFPEITSALWAKMLQVNLTGTFESIQAALPDMVAGGWGRIVTISSVAGQTGSPRQAHYAASKGGVIALTKAFALEYAAHGITANTIPPYSVDTPMLRAAQEAGHLPGIDALAARIPARRLGSVHDVASVCTFLCSDEAGYITGQVIAANGGAVT
jgi:NAD(P)-dependent dehydrogenase (short-subunit alcohol dehydrogenase family)